jgi:hypothetical protein
MGDLRVMKCPSLKLEFLVEFFKKEFKIFFQG